MRERDKETNATGPIDSEKKWTKNTRKITFLIYNDINRYADSER